MEMEMVLALLWTASFNFFFFWKCPLVNSVIYLNANYTKLFQSIVHGHL